MKTATATAHTNIALIKYWGKRNVSLNLPTTSSLSLTLDPFYTTTTVNEAKEDNLIINNQMADPTRIHRFLDYLRQEWGDFAPVTVQSRNHVPTAAGLASSASAFAAVTGATARALDLDLPLTELSRIARHGSGSATRSFYGNFALWQAGDDDQSSYAVPLQVPALPIVLIVAEISGLQKKVSSSDGMQRAMTSPLYDQWVAASAEQLTAMQTALQASDLAEVGAIAEANALAMHQLNLTATDRRFTYFTPDTVKLIDFVKTLRNDGYLAYVTLDAGPNVKIITQTDQVSAIMAKIQDYMPKIRLTTAQPGPGISYE